MRVLRLLLLAALALPLVEAAATPVREPFTYGVTAPGFTGLFFTVAHGAPLPFMDVDARRIAYNVSWDPTLPPSALGRVRTYLADYDGPTGPPNLTLIGVRLGVSPIGLDHPGVNLRLRDRDRIYVEVEFGSVPGWAQVTVDQPYTVTGAVWTVPPA